MFLAEPSRTQYDLNFRILGFPVRISPWFWLAAVILGANLHDGVLILMWVFVLLLSILIHELGHALAYRYFGMSAHIVLYHFGGLAVSDAGYGGFSEYSAFGSKGRRGVSSRDRIIISAAGPVAGFIFAALVVALVFATGGRVLFDFSLMDISSGDFFPWAIDVENMQTLMLVHLLLFVNIFWGLVNLLPIYPLDGGQISRELLVSADPHSGIQRSLMVSFVAAIVMAAVGLLVMREIFIGLMFASLAYTSYAIMNSFGGPRW